MNKETVFPEWFLDIIKARSYLLTLGLFFLVSIHYWEVNNGGSGLSIPYNVVSWAVVSWLIGQGLYRIARGQRLVYSDLTAWLLAAVILLCIPTLYPGSNLLNESAPHLGLLGGFLCFVAVQQFRPDAKDLEIILFLALAGILIEALIAWKHYLGISFTAWQFEGPGAEVPYGTIKQRNVMSTLMVMGLVISAYMLSGIAENDRAAWDRALRRCLVLAAPLLTIPLILLLKSRTGWVAGSTAIVLLLPYLYACAGKNNKRLWAASAVLGLAIVPVLEIAGIEAVVVPEAKLNLDGPRSFFLPQIFDLALTRPLAGYGFGNFESAYNLFAAQGYADGVYATPGYENLSHPHNELLYWWVEGGIIALAGLLLAAYMVLKKILTLDGVPKRLAVLALFFPIVLHTQTELPFYTSITHWILFIVLLLAVDIMAGKSREARIGYRLLPGILSVAIPVLVTVFMVTTLQSGRLLNRVERDMSVNVDILEGITNPMVWQDRLMWDMNFGLLALAVYQDRPELAENYIAWAPEIIARKPRAGYFQFLVVAYKVVGDEEQARRVQDEAEYRFPGKDFDFDLSAFRTIDNKDIEAIRPNALED